MLWGVPTVVRSDTNATIGHSYLIVGFLWDFRLDYLGKGKGWPLGSHLWCLTVSLLLSHWYPGSGVVLDCIDSWSLHPYLLGMCSDTGRYFLIRYIALGCDIITIGQFLVTRSATTWCLVYIRLHTLRQDCPDWVHDEVPIWYDHHDWGSRFGAMWHAHIPRELLTD